LQVRVTRRANETGKTSTAKGGRTGMQRESDNRRREMKDKGANYPPVSPGIISNSEA
jgi:hypothetical protein